MKMHVQTLLMAGLLVASTAHARSIGSLIRTDSGAVTNLDLTGFGSLNNLSLSSVQATLPIKLRALDGVPFIGTISIGQGAALLGALGPLQRSLPTLPGLF